MQDHSHYTQELAAGGIFFACMGSFRSSTRAHGVPFVPLSTPRAHT